MYADVVDFIIAESNPEAQLEHNKICHFPTGKRDCLLQRKSLLTPSRLALLTAALEAWIAFTVRSIVSPPIRDLARVSRAAMLLAEGARGRNL